MHKPLVSMAQYSFLPSLDTPFHHANVERWILDITRPKSEKDQVFRTTLFRPLVHAFADVYGTTDFDLGDVFIFV